MFNVNDDWVPPLLMADVGLLCGVLSVCLQQHAEPGRVQSDYECRGCGYRLEGLGTAATCPECGRENAGVFTVSGRTVLRWRSHPLAGTFIVLAAIAASLILQPLNWQWLLGFESGTRRPLPFSGLANDTLIGGYLGGAVATLGYLALVPFLGDRWVRASLLISVATLLGGTAGLVLAWHDRWLWHANASGWALIGTAGGGALGVIAAGVFCAGRPVPTLSPPPNATP